MLLYKHMMMLPPLVVSTRALTASFPPTQQNSGDRVVEEVARVDALYRFAVKGLGPTTLSSVTIGAPGETFPDDRRFALLKRKNASSFDGDNPSWLHKENFLCAFSDPYLMAGFDCDYSIVGSGEGGEEQGESEQRRGGGGAEGARVRRLLTVYRRDRASGRRIDDDAVALGPVDLSFPEGRSALGDYFSVESGEDVVCVAASTAWTGGEHVHQFGNTRSGVRERGDTRTVHLVNAATVRDVSARIGVPLRPGRFRPNIVVDGLEPWAEFGWVGKRVRCRSREKVGDGGLTLDVISRTVRCEGIGIDPADPSVGKLDMPNLLQEHFPEHGPFLGVYAIVSDAGRIKLGDELVVLLDEDENGRA